MVGAAGRGQVGQEVRSGFALAARAVRSQLALRAGGVLAACAACTRLLFCTEKIYEFIHYMNSYLYESYKCKKYMNSY